MVEANFLCSEGRPDVAILKRELHDIAKFVQERVAVIVPKMGVRLVVFSKDGSTNSECSSQFQFPMDDDELDGESAESNLKEFHDFYVKLKDDSALQLQAASDDLQLRENASYRHNQQLSQLPQTSAHFSSQQVPPSLPPFREPKMQGCGLPATAHAGSAFQAPTMPSCQHPARVYTRALPTRSQVAMAEQATAPPAPYGNRSQGSDGTAAQVSADDAARGSEEVETAAALPGTLPTRMQPFLRNVVPDETPPGSDTVLGECLQQDPAASVPGRNAGTMHMHTRASHEAAQNVATQDLKDQEPGHMCLAGTGQQEDVEMHGDECLHPPPVPSDGMVQNAPHPPKRDIQMRTRAHLRSNLAITQEEDESSAELQISGDPHQRRQRCGSSPRKCRRMTTDLGSGKQCNGNEGHDPVGPVAVRTKRGLSTPARRTRSVQAHSGVDGISQQCSEGAIQQNDSEGGQGKGRGSSRPVRSKGASTGAELEPESQTRKTLPSENVTPKKASAISELRYLSTETLVTSKRARVPPTAFTMKQMGGQNESLEEEKILQQAMAAMNVVTPTADEAAARSQKCRKTAQDSSQQEPQRVRSKSAGHATAGKAVKKRPSTKADELNRQGHKGGKGVARDGERVGDVDMLKLPGVNRLKVPAHEQPVAAACPAIPQSDGSEAAADVRIEGVPSVNDIHTKIAEKLQVRNALLDSSGRVGAAQVRAQRPDFRKFIQKILDNDPSLGECGSRVLRLKPTLDLDTSFFEIEMVLEALRYNHRVEALYIHNFEHGFCDIQLDTLLNLLSLGRIWACNIGENFLVSGNGWRKFHKSMPDTVLAYTYVSEAHLQRLADLKILIRAAIRLNRILSPRREPDVCKHISNMWFNPAGPVARRHYGCASITQHDQCAANAEPLPEVVAKRKWEVESIQCTKRIYGEFVQVRDKLLLGQPDQVKRRALDPRAFESRAALRSSMFNSSPPGEELRPVRVEFKTGAEADARHAEDLKILQDPENRSFWAAQPRTRWTERSLAACMLELPEPVRALLGLSADGGPGCAEGVGSGTGTIGNDNGDNVGPTDQKSGAEANRVATAENGDGSGASNSENPPHSGATVAGAPNGASDVDGANGGAGSSSGTTRNGGSGSSAQTLAAEKKQRAMIRDGDARVTEVARGLDHLGGVKSVMTAVGSKEVQARWADPRRISTCDPYDYGNDVLAWAAKCVGGNVSARHAASDGVAELVGQRIDVFLPMFVQWVGAVVESAVEGQEDVALVTFWNGGKAHLRLRHSLVTWRLSKKQQPLPDGLSLEAHISTLS